MRGFLLKADNAAEDKLERFLHLLGITSETITPEALIGRAVPESGRHWEESACLVLSGGDATVLAESASRRGVSLEQVAAPFSEVVLHSVGGQPAHLQAIESLLGGAKLSVREFVSDASSYSVCGSRRECGALTGLLFGPIDSTVDYGLDVGSCSGTAENFIEIDGSGLLTRVRRGSQDVWISTASEIADLGEAISKQIDFRTCFSRIVPLLLALRSTFRDSCWMPQGYWANIIIDDPLLWRRYGHLNLRHLVEAVDSLGCACTIGMIPWNYRRSERKMADDFASRLPLLGICYHGCNHTGAEFGVTDHARLMHLLATARQRMDAHERLTGLPCQRVMVFPQGVFTMEAMRCLRLAGYLAVANTEIQDYHNDIRVTRQELMQPAILCYDQFPLFTRRNPGEGIVNFAVDIFLGKPCLIVLHHEFFKDGLAAFEALSQNISRLHPQLSWTNLENISMGCVLTRFDAQGRREVRAFANNDNVSLADDAIGGVHISGEPVDSRRDNGCLRIPTTSGTGQSAPMRIRPESTDADSFLKTPMRERLRVAARRYASEFRDNYLSRSEPLLKGARHLRRFIYRK